MDTMKDTLIFLCDLTGNMAEPWLKHGYNAILVDPQHPDGVSTETLTNGATITRIGSIITSCMQHIGEIIRSGRVLGVFGFPPCTDVSLSGTRWWEAKRKSDPYFQAKAAIVAEQCRTIGEISGGFWFFENPKSAFSRIFGAPQHKFHPHHFSALCANDNYTKETWLWTGGGFVMPGPQVDYSIGEPDHRIHTAPPSARRSNFRSATPIGFALAVFMANAPETRNV